MTSLSQIEVMLHTGSVDVEQPQHQIDEFEEHEILAVDRELGLQIDCLEEGDDLISL